MPTFCGRWTKAIKAKAWVNKKEIAVKVDFCGDIRKWVESEGKKINSQFCLDFYDQFFKVEFLERLEIFFFFWNCKGIRWFLFLKLSRFKNNQNNSKISQNFPILPQVPVQHLPFIPSSTNSFKWIKIQSLFSKFCYPAYFSQPPATSLS